MALHIPSSSPAAAGAAVLLALLAPPTAAQIGGDMFRHHYIARELPADHGWGFGTPMLADIDHDGDLDFAVSNRNDAIYWFEFSPSGWKRHVLGAITNGQLGSVSLDVDGDAHVDLVIGGYWYRNPGNPREARFERIAYDPAIRGEIHDMVAADVDADGRPDVVATGDEDGCFWYRIPRDPLADRVWERHVITLDVLDSNDHIHSGFVPGGVGDLDILAADQEDPSILPAGATPRFYVFENTGNVHERFLERVVFDGRLGGHDIRVGDVDGDGDLDFVSKIWNRWPGNANGGKFHADYFENLRKRPAGGK